MPQPLSMDLRQRILAAYDAGEKTKAVAERFAVSPACARRLKQRRRQTGEVAPGKGRPGPKPVLAGEADRLRQAAQAEPASAPVSTATGSACPARRSPSGAPFAGWA